MLARVGSRCPLVGGTADSKRNLVEAAAKEAAGIMPSRKPSQRHRTSRPKPTRRRALIAEVIDGCQGTVARYMGDGVLAYFGSCRELRKRVSECVGDAKFHFLRFN